MAPASGGKEGVRGSSPREGFRKFLLISSFVVCGGDKGEARRPPSVHDHVRRAIPLIIQINPPNEKPDSRGPRLSDALAPPPDI